MRSTEQPLFLGVGLDHLHVGLVAGSQAQIIERHLVDRANRDGCTVLGRHVAQGRAIRDRQEFETGSIELDELTDDAKFRRRSVIVSTRSVAVAPSGSRSTSLNPTTSGMSIEIGWPSIAASASIPPTPQPTTPRPFTMVVCESVPTSVSG